MAPLTMSDLEHLKQLSLKEHDDFFRRNAHLKKAYYDSLLGICLCQGAASAYLNPKLRVKDFDVWHFYVENKEFNFPYRAHKRIESGFKGKPIDFLKRAVSKNTFDSCSGNPERTIIKYLLERNTRSKRLLLKKAVIGLFPDVMCGRVLWKGEQ